MPPRVILRVVVSAAVALAASAAGAHESKVGAAPALSEAPHLAVIRNAPDFTLIDAAGQQVRLMDLRGRVVLIAFIYTGCQAACPLLSHRMALLQARLKKAGLSADRVRLLSITVDPERDSAAVLAHYAGKFNAGAGWHFLRESPERLLPVLTAYDEWSTRLANGELDHPARLHLIDPTGRVREIYSLAFFDERQAFADIVALKRNETPHVERR
jgi:protein SCO1/2